MKKLFLALAAVFAVGGFTAEASANTQCTDTMNAMTQLIHQYIDVLKSCQELKSRGLGDSQHYRDYQYIAGSIEETYGRAVDLCNRVCEHTRSCNGPGPRAGTACP